MSEDLKREQLKRLVLGEVARLSHDTSATRRDLAVLRHGVASEVGEDIGSWSYLMMLLPKELQGTEGDASYAENAACIALTLYAAGNRRHIPGVGIGQAAAALGENSRGRFFVTEACTDIPHLRVCLRGLIHLIASGKDTGIDYGMLAEDLYEWQFNRIKVVRKWERDYSQKGTKNERR